MSRPAFLPPVCAGIFLVPPVDGGDSSLNAGIPAPTLQFVAKLEKRGHANGQYPDATDAPTREPSRVAATR
jgi:hypothetical protein